MNSRQPYRQSASCLKPTRYRTARPRPGYRCVLELLRNYFDIQDADDPTAKREKVRAVFAALDPALQDTLPYLFGLLGIVEGADPLAQMDPRIKRGRTLDAIKRIVLRESLKQPLIVILEDLHWIDEQTQALLDALADSLANARVLLLVNYRPEYSHQWVNKSYYVQIGLSPLVGANAETMLAALLGAGAELRPLKRLIIDRTGGNPFFIEEMVQTLFDEGALVRNGVVKVARSLSQLRLPPTVQGILAARIDRLSSEQKELLQMLAVIGRESPLGLIGKMTAAASAQLGRMLAELRAAEFIYEQPALADTAYIFKHALTQEVAYNSLLIERRKLLHERAGQALESIFAQQLDDHLGQLAHHYSHSDNIDKAVEYLSRAGQQAMQRCSYVDAIGCVSEGLDRLKAFHDNVKGPERELSLQLTLGASLMASKGWAVPEVEEAFSRAQELCRLMGEVPQLVPVLYGIWGFYFVRGELKRAAQVGAQLLTLAEAAANPVFAVAAYFALSLTFHRTGDLDASRERFAEMMQHYAPQQHQALTALFGQDLGIGGITDHSMGLWLLGYPDQALEAAEKAVRMARDIAHPESLAWALLGNSMAHHFRRDEGQARAATEELFSVCEANGLVMQPTIAKLIHGWVLAVEGNGEHGCAEIREAFQAFSAMGLVLMEGQGHAMLAEAYWYAGKAEDGLLSLEESLTTAKSEDRHFGAELCRLRAELLRLRADTDRMSIDTEAEALFRQAIETARHQHAKSLELRATSSLARLLEHQGRRDEARTILAEIYNWFTEGFDTADLKDAKSLLDELSM
jgi:predicted ATPase